MTEEIISESINEEAMDFVLKITYEAGLSFISHTYFLDFILNHEKNILSSPPGSGKTSATLQYLFYHLYLSNLRKKTSITKKKIIWAIPLKALAESIKEEAMKFMTTPTFLKWYIDYNLKEGTKKYEEFIYKFEKNDLEGLQKYVEEKIGIVIGTGASHRISLFWFVILTYEHLGIFMTHPTNPFPDAVGISNSFEEQKRDHYLESMTPEKSFFSVIIDEIHYISDRKRGLVIDQIISSCNFLKIKWIGISGTLPDSLLKLLPPAYIVNYNRRNTLQMWEFNSRNPKIGKSIASAVSITTPSISSIIYAENKINPSSDDTPRVLVFLNSVHGCENIFHEVVQNAVESDLISFHDIETYIPSFSLRENELYGTVTFRGGEKANTIAVGYAYGILISHAQLIIPTKASGNSSSSISCSSYEKYKERICSSSGDWSCIISTTTLAVGVNLAPVSHVVVLEEPNSLSWTQKELIQMIGRTGRTKDGHSIVVHDYVEFKKTINSFTGYRASIRAFAKYILPLFASFSDIPIEQATQKFSTFWTPRSFYDDRMPDDLKDKLIYQGTYLDFIRIYVNKLQQIHIIKHKDTLLSIYSQANKFDMDPENVLTASLIGSHIVDFAEDEIEEYSTRFQSNEAYSQFQELLILYSSLLISGTRLSKEFREIYFNFKNLTLETFVIDFPIDKQIQREALQLAAKITQQASDNLIGIQEMRRVEFIARLLYHFSETGTIGVSKEFLNDCSKSEKEKKTVIQKNAILFFNKCGMNFARFLFLVGGIVSIEANLQKTSELREVKIGSCISNAWWLVWKYIDDAISSDTRKWESVERRSIKNGSTRIPWKTIFLSLFTESENDNEAQILNRKNEIRDEHS
ncbi:hypothetical protein TRFO_22971 [Tritrichomonas foetus]|uniref:Uncharacterized protein n=1 Tax=Tritrichomonas foetus TaxID=1144522 RepID=A0A1J4KGL9_9EUKA|nr:hypothetical protein TRFO_22971 [Tritrichomonas foetus]|eukprot:OHT08469.1 hypothetical protein TRFO_22971 [Tritrichomonas foetus]